MLKSITIDFANQVVSVNNEKRTDDIPLASAQAFSILSAAWVRCGWDVKYVYSFSWLGRPVIQLPEDLLRMQELVYRVKPDVIIETGIAHGGSLVFYASLCKSIGKGRIIGVDVEIRPHNRKAIEEHELFPLITLLEGDSVSPAILAQVESKINPGDRVLVVLDSCHTKEHVLAELQAYSRFVSVGSYIVAMDGIMEKVAGAPRTKPDWSWNNPRQAALEFIQSNKKFVIEKPSFVFNEGSVEEWITYSPDGILLRAEA
jgi:cephalosporin hydroxylase